MDDYIDREKIFSIWRSMPAPASVTSLAAAISQTPAADVRPVVRGRCEKDTPMGYKCSVCGCLMPGKSNFCPNCGADMRGGDEL